MYKKIVISLVTTAVVVGCVEIPTKNITKTYDSQQIPTKSNQTSDILTLSKILVNNLFGGESLEDLYCCGNIIVTTFVDLNNFDKTSNFGRLLSESVSHNIRKRDIEITDVRVAKNIMIKKENGELVLSREARNLYEKYKTQYLLMGTYSKYEQKVVVHLKIVDINSNIVVASSEAILTKIPESIEIDKTKSEIDVKLF